MRWQAGQILIIIWYSTFHVAACAHMWYNDGWSPRGHPEYQWPIRHQVPFVPFLRIDLKFLLWDSCGAAGPAAAPSTTPVSRPRSRFLLLAEAGEGHGRWPLPVKPLLSRGRLANSLSFPTVTCLCLQQQQVELIHSHYGCSPGQADILESEFCVTTATLGFVRVPLVVSSVYILCFCFSWESFNITN